MNPTQVSATDASRATHTMLGLLLILVAILFQFKIVQNTLILLLTL